MPSLLFDKVDISYNTISESGRQRIDAVKGASLSLPEGGTLGVAGESGSGKTTLAMSVLRLLPRNAEVRGKILLGDREMLSLGWGQLRAVRWDEASVVFQGAMHSLNPVRQVGRQIQEAIHLHRSKLSARERERIVANLLEQVDLPGRVARSYAHELSGGQKQRAMIAMALCCDPNLIIADEPTTALDVLVQAQVLDLLSGLVQRRGISLMMISHDLSVLARVCERIAVMYRGEIVEVGPSRQILAHPEHPHTKALADAFPLIGDPASRLHPITRYAEDPGHPESAQTPDTVPTPVRRGAGGEKEAVIRVERLDVVFSTRGGPVSAVDNVSFDCREGEIVALVGQSGSGKTTLARIILGLLEPTRGRVLFEGRPLGHGIRGLRAYRRQVQLILQDPADALNPKHTVYEAIAEGIRVHRLPGNERDRVEQALAQAEMVPPQPFLSALPQELSGGQQQRVVIAGALALNPRFLVADEPVSSLDASLRGEILALLLRLKRTLGLGALVITHDLGVAWNIADRVMVIHQGKLVENGPTEQVLLHPKDEYTKKLLAAVPRTDLVAAARSSAE